jgi:hypothetical protein
MIRIILSGEGSSDFGAKDYQTKEFVPGPIAAITEKILTWCSKTEFSFNFIHRNELKRHPITLKGKKKTGPSTGKGHSNLAYKLAYLAKDGGYDMAILMRDARKTEFEAVCQEIRDGYAAAKFDSGIPAVPVTESEAWIIACIIPERSHRIEDCSCDMKVKLRQLLEEQNKHHDRDTWNEIAEGCPVDSIKSRSFVQYREDIKEAVEYLW